MTGTIETTALPLDAIAPDPSAIVTGASPLTPALGPRLYQITTGGTAGDESLVLPAPDLPIDGQYNDQLMGLRIIFSLVDRTDPADVVVVTAASGLLGSSYQTGIPYESIRLDFVGASLVLLWAGYGWVVDEAAGGGNFTPTWPDGFSSTLGMQAIQSNGHGTSVHIVTGNTTNEGERGGDILVNPGVNLESGESGYTILAGLPQTDPHYGGALWNDGGTLKVSAG